jgi:DNA-binding NtrC family response regulator
VSEQEQKALINSDVPLQGGNETILIVEDEEAILGLGLKILERLGYRVLTANTPQHAIEVLEAYPDPVHLLITDVVMPEMNGRDLTNLLTKLKPALKCLFMSGYNANIIAHQGVLDEGVLFIQKPFSMRSLAEKVRLILDQD